MQPPSYKVFKIRKLVHEGRFVNEDNCYFIYLFIYTVLIERAIHNSMCSNALIHTYKGIHNYTCI